MTGRDFDDGTGQNMLDRPLTYETEGPRFEMRQVYGRPLAYPTDHLAAVFCRLVGRPTLTPAQVRIIRDELGYCVQMDTPSPPELGA